jgi:hypothetical protein
MLLIEGSIGRSFRLSLSDCCSRSFFFRKNVHVKESSLHEPARVLESERSLKRGPIDVSGVGLDVLDLTAINLLV